MEVNTSMRRMLVTLGLSTIVCASMALAASTTKTVQHHTIPTRWQAQDLKGTVSMVDPQQDLVVVRDSSGVPFDIRYSARRTSWRASSRQIYRSWPRINPWMCDSFRKRAATWREKSRCNAESFLEVPTRSGLSRKRFVLLSSPKRFRGWVHRGWGRGRLVEPTIQRYAAAFNDCAHRAQRWNAAPMVANDDLFSCGGIPPFLMTAGGSC